MAPRRASKEVIQFEDLIPYHEALVHPNRSSISVGQAKADIAAIALREQGILKSLAKRIGDRAQIIEELSSSMAVELPILLSVSGREDEERRRRLAEIYAFEETGASSSARER